MLKLKTFASKLTIYNKVYNSYLNFMIMKIHVNLNQSEDPNGWTASIARVHNHGDKEMSMGESIVHPNKELAWNSIKNEAKNLNYEEDEILFNLTPVKDYLELENKVNEL